VSQQSVMTHKCIGCKRTFPHKTGLSNHRRVCTAWKNYDTVTVQKKRRLEEEQEKNNSRTLGLVDQNTEVLYLCSSCVIMYDHCNL